MSVSFHRKNYLMETWEGSRFADKSKSSLKFYSISVRLKKQTFKTASRMFTENIIFRTDIMYLVT